jgi:NADH-quinone oxidoreductase subunit N
MVMQLTDLIAISPLLLLTATCVLIMLQIALWRDHTFSAILALVGLAAAISALPAAYQWRSDQVTALITVDAFGLFFTGLILATTAATVMLGLGYLKCIEGHCEEFFLLMMIAALGACVLTSSRHFGSFFLGLETLSISLYALIAYPRLRMESVEAAVKYLVLGTASSAFLLFGIALIYAFGGALDFSGVTALRFAMIAPDRSPMLLTGIAMLVIGIGFKLALVPFHMWAADVYQGAPAPVTAFVATVSKSAMVALLVRLFAPIDVLSTPSIFWVLASTAFASMIVGNLLALQQTSVKRILAYSSIAHLGYLMTAFISGGRSGIAAVMFYMVAYTITSLGAFGVISVLSGRQGDADRLTDFRGLFYRRPWTAGVFTAMLLSLAGIPLTAGFIGKFFLVTAGAQAQLWWLVITLVLASAVSIFYYLRIIVVMFTALDEAQVRALHPAALDLPGSLVLATMALMLVWIGIWPESLLDLIRAMAN